MAPSGPTANESGLVTIRVFGALRELAGPSPLAVAPALAPSVNSLLAWLDEQRPQLAAALRSGLHDGYLNVLVNGRNARFLQAERTPLVAGDAVAFLPPIGGG